MPAVVGTGHATKLIKTGDRVRVDGDSGVVTIVR
jgi:pyruvate,water dikinase